MTALIIIGCILGYALLSLTIIPLSAFVEVADCLTNNTAEYTNFKTELKCILANEMDEEAKLTLIILMVFWPLAYIFILFMLFHFFVARKLINKIIEWCDS